MKTIRTLSVAFLKSLLRISLAILSIPATLVAIAGIFWLYSVIERGDLDERFPPPGQMIDLGTHRLHLNCSGGGSPTVILEAGSSSFSSHWSLAQETLSDNFRVCSYDRGGPGWSERGPEPRTTDTLVNELERLLSLSGEAPPYLMVGTSFGGNLAWQFTQENRGKVSGLIVIETPTLEFMNTRRNMRPIPSADVRLFVSPVMTTLMTATEYIFPADPESPINRKVTESQRIAATDPGFRSRMKYASLREQIDPARMREMQPLDDLPLVVMQGTLSAFGAGSSVFTVASIASGCMHCQAHGGYTLHLLGVSPERIRDIWTFEQSEDFSAAEKAALRLARDAATVPGGVLPMGIASNTKT